MLVLTWIARAYRSATAYIEAVRAAEALRGMTDHQLRDIGIDRDQIDQLVFGEKAVSAKTAKANARPAYKRPAFSLAELS